MSRNLHDDAEDAKTRGNECLKNEDFDGAIKWYSQALDFAKHLKEGNNRHVYYSNRSAAYLSKQFADSALKDAESCIKEKPDWPKGYVRKGAALHAQKKYADSIAAYEAGLKYSPGDTSLQKGLEEVKAEQDGLKSGRSPGGFPFGAAGSGGGSEEETLGRMFSDPAALEMLKANPKTSAYMNDPSFLKTLELVAAQPNMLPQLMQMDKRLLAALSVILGVNIKDPDERKAEEEKRQKEDAEKEKKRKEAEETARRALETPEERAQRERMERAKAHKDAGNAHYKKREFDQALAEYENALQEDPTDMTFHLNKASVFLERQELEPCLAECDKAIEVGRSHGAKYEQIAKAFERRGNAFVKADKLQEALSEYRKAQLEFRTSDVDDRILKVERTLKQRSEKAYVNPEIGKQAAERGNSKLVAGDFPGAISEFNEAIARDPTNANYRIDRCTAYTKLLDFGRAKEDIDKAIELDPTLVRAYARRGKIETFTKQYHKALTSYRKGLSLDPNDQDCIDGLRIVETAIQNQSRAATDDDQEAKIRSQRAMEDPEIRSIMQDPVMAQVLRDLSSDPKSARKHLSNPTIAEKIEKLIAAGILKTG
jgi:stress-induced-phosphoprotein 1